MLRAVGRIQVGVDLAALGVSFFGTGVSRFLVDMSLYAAAIALAVAAVASMAAAWARKAWGQAAVAATLWHVVFFATSALLVHWLPFDTALARDTTASAVVFALAAPAALLATLLLPEPVGKDAPARTDAQPA